MKAILDVWKNANGWSWRVETHNWELVAGRSYRTRDLAVASARAICTSLRRAKIELV